MQFTFEGNVYDGASIKKGLLGSIPYGEQRWLAKELKIRALTDLDVIGSRLAYYFLAIRKKDHRALPVSRFDELTIDQFVIVPHVVDELDRDGDCAICSQAVDDTEVHLEGDAEPVPTSSPGPQS